MSFYRTQPFHNRQLSYNDINMLEFYTQQYNDTYYRINQLQRSLERINENINRIYFGEQHNHSNNNIYNNNNTSYRNRNTNRTRNYDASSYLFEPVPQRNTPLSPLRRPRDSLNILNHRDTRWADLLPSFFSNVPIFATSEEIRRATTVVRYRDIEYPLNETCPISLERFTDDSYVTQLNHCGHLFNTNELNTWFENNVRCPVCRHDIRNTSHESVPSPSSPGEHANTTSTTQTTDSLNLAGTDNTFTSELITRLTDQLITSLYGENTETDSVFETNVDGSRIIYDASNNTFLFEAYIPLYRENRM